MAAMGNGNPDELKNHAGTGPLYRPGVSHSADITFMVNSAA
ncbi:hypothetical protein ACFOGG_13020 [Brenneria rubrifaciens]